MARDLNDNFSTVAENGVMSDPNHTPDPADSAQHRDFPPSEPAADTRSFGDPSSDSPPPPSGLSQLWDGDTREMARAPQRYLGPYRVDLKIGEGGMGVVYKAFDTTLDRFVAIKVLKEKLLQNERYLVRLKREARAIASVSHPNVIQIFSFEDGTTSTNGESGLSSEAAQNQIFNTTGVPYIVMEFVGGESVDGRLRRGERYEIDAAIELLLGASRGLQAALERGIVHRDVKPSNLLIANSDTLKIVDFGLSKDLDADASITDDGIVLGTPHYISPEQGQGHAVDHHSDIYSLGATFYHMITGRPVFHGDSHASIIYSHVHTAPVPPESVCDTIPQQISDIVGKMLAKQPSSRYDNYAEVIADLERARSGRGLGRETMIVGRKTWGTPWWRTKSAFWFTAGLAASTCVALLLVVTLVAVEVTRPSAQALNVARYEVTKTTTGESVFDFDFRRLTTIEELDALFVVPKPDVALDSKSGVRCSAGSSGLVFRYPVEKIDEIQLKGLRITGRADFAIGLGDKDGGDTTRLLRFAFRGDEGTNVDRPVVARWHQEEIPLDPRPAPLPPLVDSPYDVTIHFQANDDGTRVRLSINTSDRTAGIYPKVFPEEGYLIVKGKDWSRGLLRLWAERSRDNRSKDAFQVESLKIIGTIDRERWIEPLEKNSRQRFVMRNWSHAQTTDH